MSSAYQILQDMIRRSMIYSFSKMLGHQSLQQGYACHEIDDVDWWKAQKGMIA